MKKIKLNGRTDKEALIDNEDFDKINKYKWYPRAPNKNVTYATLIYLHKRLKSNLV